MIEWLCNRFITGENVIISDAAKELRNKDYNNNNNNNNNKKTSLVQDEYRILLAKDG